MNNDDTDFDGGIEKKLGSGWFGSGRSAEIFDGVFPGILFTLGYFQVSCVYLMFRFTRNVRYTRNIG